MEHSYCWNVGC